MMKPGQKIRLGDLLVENRHITEKQLMAALASQKKSGKKLGRTMIDLDYITEDELLAFLASQLKIAVIDLKHFQFNDEIVRKLPETMARRYRALALSENAGELTVGMADPTDIFAYDEISKTVRMALQVAIVRENDLLEVLDRGYRKTEQISSLAVELNQELSASDIDLTEMLNSSENVEAPVVKLLQSIFDDAVQVGASDIHIEPDEHVLRIRQRIDGMLQEQVMKEKRIGTALVSRLKLMSGLNISEKRLPQDGRFNVRVKDRSIDVRVSTMPLQYGESVVMRLLDQSGGNLNLERVGMPAKILERFRHFIHKPHGMVLVTGPTGSGKTTTLYGALNELNIASRKIITVEDPVEYRLSRINQVQVHAQIGLTFASVLRTALRQDPDVVLIGEMRDQETAEIGLRAAITGHLVLSTLHTNDSISTAVRLIDMGIPGYMVATSLEAIIAQRLVRRICTDCHVDVELALNERIWLRGIYGPEAEKHRFKRGRGCHSCNNTGYKGRIGVFELLELDLAMGDALRLDDTAAFAHAARRSKNFVSLGKNAVAYAMQGLTTIEEAIRISGEEVDPDMVVELPPESSEEQLDFTLDEVEIP
ncbi:MAG: type II/IV secretion system protein [Gammaproteobacteria bacterium]|nr:type II/IV secretion system protein [Gammaproteobacteria bacterium]